MEKSPNSKRKKKIADDSNQTNEIVPETPVETSETETANLAADEVSPTVSVNENPLAAEDKTIETPAETVEFSPESDNTVTTDEPEVIEPVAAEEVKTKPAMVMSATGSTPSGGEGISSLGKALIVGLFILLAGVGLLIWKSKTGGGPAMSSNNEGLTKLTKEDMELLLKDANPALLKQLAENPETKKKQVESIKQLLAVAQEARKTDKWSDDPKENKQVKDDLQEEMDDIRTQITAISYDREKNKDKEQMPPFSLIKKEDVDAYYQNPANAEKVNTVLQSKIAKAQEEGIIPKGQQPSEEELGQFKDQYAKINIYYKEAQDNWDKLSPEFKHQTDLQIKLQQAQLLARTYAEKVLAKKVEAKDEDIAPYLAAHPDADPNGDIKKYMDEHPPLTKDQKKAKADDLLKRAKAGEDFAKLAKENSEDPGSKNDGGLYKDVAKGQMMPEFEKAALALEPGQIADNLIETKYGYHIIKLERKGVTKDKDGKEQDTYDARHILISTTNDDPQSPLGQIKQKIEADREKTVLDEIVAKNPVEVAEDFEVKVPPMPEGQPNGLPPGMKLTPQQMEQLQKQMKEQQDKQKKDGSSKSDAPKPDVKKAPPANK